MATVRDDCFAGETLATLDDARAWGVTWCRDEYGARRHSRTQVKVFADVAIGHHQRLTRMDAHAHTDRSAAEGPLRVKGSREGPIRVAECDEERVALGVNLDAAVR